MSPDRVHTAWSIILALTALAHGCVAPSRDMVAKSQMLEKVPLQGADVMAFAVMRDTPALRGFYEGQLGLRVLSEEPKALMLNSGGTVIRIQKSADHQPAPYTVLGWKVPDIRASAARLAAKGITVERYEWMEFQDDSGIATFSNGDMVAWFKDPDGNILSIAQLAGVGNTSANASPKRSD